MAVAVVEDQVVELVVGLRFRLSDGSRMSMRRRRVGMIDNGRTQQNLKEQVLNDTV